MPVRRAADPISVQHVWDAIRFSNCQRQMADLPRILKYLMKLGSCTAAEAELYVKQTLKDGLIVAVQKTTVKGVHVGSQVESYKIPIQELAIPKDDGKDWYCIECHLAGDVTPCRFCFRVFHTECSTKARQKLDSFQYKLSMTNNTKTINNGIASKDVKTDEIEKELQKLEEDGGNSSTQESASTGAELIDLETENMLDNTVDTRKPINTVESAIYDESLCSVCNLSKSSMDCNLDKEELNHLLTFILTRIRSWLPKVLTNSMTPDAVSEWMTETECSWRASQLFYQHMDMVVMDLKLKAKEYSKLGEFYSDVITVQHNVAVFHGIESQEYGAADLMVQDCIHDINELMNCADCYKHSNEKINSKWFCLPCRNPHSLVWAKQKGYPYWPAKVMKETDTNYDVRFFGGKYERSVLPKSLVKPISTNMQSLNIKKSSAFNRAYQELLLHQKLLADPAELTKLTKSKKKISKPPRHSLEVPSKPVNKSTKRKHNSLELNKDVYDFDEPAVPKLSIASNSFPRKPSPKKLKQSAEQLTKIKSKMKPERQKKNSTDVINISDGEESEYQFPQDDYQFGSSYDSGYEQVTSSTEYFRDDNFAARDNSENSMHQLDQPYCDAVEKMRRKLETCKDKSQLIKIAMDCMQTEVDKITNDHNEHLKKLFESHNAQISETKKKQWCYNCEQDAIYHCCWNTAYCSPTCQQQHWQAEHKKVCRRKR